jgi:hypothetical protein
MELQTPEVRTAAVSHRIGELRRLARTLRLERRRGGPRFRGLRLALGRRLVIAGVALLDGAASRRPATIR